MIFKLAQIVMSALTIANARTSLLPPAPLRASERRGFVGIILAAHLLLLWGVLQLETVRRTVAEAAPVMVRLISLTPPKPPEPMPPPARPVVSPQAPALQIPVDELTTVPPPEVKVAAAPAPAITAVPAAAPAPPPPQAPPVAAPRVIPPSAVHYIVAPALEVPLASRRLGETGTVVLRVVIGRDGLPKQIVVHQSSGFARLDEQAVSAMWQARFKPHHENGQPIEAIALAACSYELE